VMTHIDFHCMNNRTTVSAINLLYCSNEKEKKVTYISDGLRVSKSRANFHVCVNYPF